MIALLLAAPAALGNELTATKGKVTATLSWDDHPLPEPDTNIRLRVQKGGTVVADGVEVATDEDFRSIIETSSEPPAVAVRDLDGDGKPEVLVSTFSGGAYCCWDTQVYSDPEYKLPTTFDFRESPWRLRDLGRGEAPDFTLGAPTYQFVPVSHAATGLPLVVLNYTAKRRFVDVSRRFKPRLRRDAKVWKAEWLKYPRGDDEAQGALAAYVADLLRLGKDHKAETEIQRAGRKDQLPDGTLGFHKDLNKLMKALRGGHSSPFAHPEAP